MLKRFSISLEDDLLEGFDDYIVRHGYSNRSEAVRDLIRKVFFFLSQRGALLDSQIRWRSAVSALR
ncbi:MAG TPA: ribbon-helix-helix protein, CopG family [Epsilonproteobacteria bacterium]|nr:ribbon-helix-helix protein, CopG family [Campylobacterota bacterium]